MRPILRSLAFITFILAIYFRRGSTAVVRPDPPAFFRLVRRVLAVDPAEQVIKKQKICTSVRKDACRNDTDTGGILL